MEGNSNNLGKFQIQFFKAKHDQNFSRCGPIYLSVANLKTLMEDDTKEPPDWSPEITGRCKKSGKFILLETRTLARSLKLQKENRQRN